MDFVHEGRARRMRVGPHTRMAIALALAPAMSAQAALIDDDGFFDDLPTGLITFDEDGDGSPVVLGDGASSPMPTNEYADLGVTFSPAVRWVNDGNASFDGAQQAIGLGEIAIPSVLVNTFDIQFSTTVRSVGMWVIANNSDQIQTQPTFTAFDAQGGVIEMVTFGGMFVDGTIGIADYGFMGISTSTPIARLQVTKQAAIFDDLHFSSQVPAPGAAVLLGLGGACLASRRRRG